MKHKITLIPGDGIGPDVSDAAKRCVEALGVDITWDVQEAGQSVMEKYGTPLPEQTLESIRKNKVAIKGPITTPIGVGFRSVNVQLRKSLDLFACVRPFKTYEGIRSSYKNIDIVVIRENTEDLYSGIELDIDKQETKKAIDSLSTLTNLKINPDSALSIKAISRSASKRIAEFAFQYALKNNRKKVTCVHKANIMKFTDGLFMRTAEEVSRSYQGKILYEDRLVDNLAMQLVQKPNDYDVLLCPNLYGDILSDLCAGLVGGLGVAPGSNIGKEIAIFEPTHGSAPKYKGQNKVNPTATILSAVMMLRYIGENEAAKRLEEAVKAVLKEGRSVTYDLKERRDDPTAAGTSQMADEIIRKIKK